MKFSYSLLKKILPQIPSKKAVVAELTMHSFEAEEGGGDTLLIDVPANRYSDAASHLGIARELAVILGKKLRDIIPDEKVVGVRNRGLLKARVAQSEDCPRYALALLKLAKMPRTPAWMRKVLSSCGIQPINGVVDIMNYVMLEIGQPLHAFDADRLQSLSLSVRRAKENERITTLDGQQKALPRGTLVIAEGNTPLAIAGIKGGIHAGIGDRTSRIVIEAANFSPSAIYRASRALGLVTDAALRFSHFLSPLLVEWGIRRAVALLAAQGAILEDSIDIYPNPCSEEVIEFDLERYRRLIGTNIARRTAEQCFRGLGFVVMPLQKRKDALLVKVPAWRTDIASFEDLAEEIARFEGYESLPSTPPRVAVLPPQRDDSISLQDRARILLTGMRVDEIYSSSFLSQELAEEYKGSVSGEVVRVENPISEEGEYLRPSLLPRIAIALSENAKFFPEVRVFEIGKVFSYVAKGSIRERWALGIGIATKKDERIALELKGIVHRLLGGLGGKDVAFSHYDGALRITVAGEEVGILYPLRRRKGILKKGWHAALAEIDLEKILLLVEEEEAFRPIAPYPSVTRDISLLVHQDTRVGELIAAMEQAGSELLSDIDMLDEYRSDAFPGKRSITLRVVLQPTTRTLRDEEIQEEISRIVRVAEQNFGAVLRT